MHGLQPYSTYRKATVLNLTTDHVYSADAPADAIRQVMSFQEVVPGNASAGLIATNNVVVDKNAKYTNGFEHENTPASPPTSVVHNHHS